MESLVNFALGFFALLLGLLGGAFMYLFLEWMRNRGRADEAFSQMEREHHEMKARVKQELEKARKNHQA